MDQIISSYFNLDVLRQSLPYLQHGLILTFWLTLAIVPLAMLAGLVVAMLFDLRVRLLNYALIFYIDLFRAFPPLVLIIFIFFGLPFLGIRFSEFTSFVLASTLNGAAYFGEIFRAGIASIPRGQYEAAISTGLRPVQAMAYVVLPQAVRNVLAPLTGNVIELVKATSLASVVAMPELLRSARIAQGATYNATPLVAAALIYLVLLWPSVRLASRLERRALAKR
jgi:polar amino acid transport system permease protein